MAVNSQLSEQEKISLVREYQQSGLSYRKFYQQNKDRIGVSDRAFCTWMVKYKDAAMYGIQPDQNLTGISEYRKTESGGIWVKTDKRNDNIKQSLREFAEGFSDEIPKAGKVESPKMVYKDLLSLYVITDAHIGMRSHDWNLEIAENTIKRYIEMASKQSLDSHTAVLVFQGDTAHFDSMEPVTPTNKHVLDADGNARSMNRVIINVARYCVQRLLKKHKHVHIIFALGNHDLYTSVIQSEWLAVHYEDEPRVTVDTSDELYHVYEWGLTSLYFHHGHKRGLNKDLDRVFAGMFHDIYGRTKYRYGHIGHFHHQRVLETQLMRMEIHPTLSGKDDYARHGGYVSQRMAKVITYSKKYGMVNDTAYTPEMLLGG